MNNQKYHFSLYSKCTHQIWSSWDNQTAAEGAAVDSITNSTKSTYLMNMKRTKETGMYFGADDNSIHKKKDNVATTGDIPNQNDGVLESKEDISKINQSSPSSKKSSSLSAPNASSKLFAKSIPLFNGTLVQATSINSR